MDWVQSSDDSGQHLQGLDLGGVEVPGLARPRPYDGEDPCCQTRVTEAQ
jgi:hypothetical protein